MKVSDITLNLRWILLLPQIFQWNVVLVEVGGRGGFENTLSHAACYSSIIFH